MKGPITNFFVAAYFAILDQLQLFESPSFRLLEIYKNNRKSLISLWHTFDSLLKWLMDNWGQLLCILVDPIKIFRFT